MSAVDKHIGRYSVCLSCVFITEIEDSISPNNIVKTLRKACKPFCCFHGEVIKAGLLISSGKCFFYIYFYFIAKAMPLTV